MATVHFGTLLGPVGFSSTVAIKRLHEQFAKDPEFVSMFLDEARVAARIRHPNVVQTLDVVATEGQIFLVMEYVQGESLSHLVRATRKRGKKIPPKIVATVLAGALHGLQAAHDAKDEHGAPLAIVHRDVSPHNGLVREALGGWESARDMARALEAGVGVASAAEVGEWVEQTATEQLRKRAARLSDIESSAATHALSNEQAHELLGAISSATGAIS